MQILSHLVDVALSPELVDVPLEVLPPENGLPREGAHPLPLLCDLLLQQLEVLTRLVELLRGTLLLPVHYETEKYAEHSMEKSVKKTEKKLNSVFVKIVLVFSIFT